VTEKASNSAFALLSIPFCFHLDDYGAVLADGVANGDSDAQDNKEREKLSQKSLRIGLRRINIQSNKKQPETQ